jgi:hypothetical protein
MTPANMREHGVRSVLAVTEAEGIFALPERVNLLEKLRQVGERPSEPVDRPAHDQVELAPGGVLAERVELGSLILPFAPLIPWSR